MDGPATGPIGRWNGRVTRWLARIAASILALLCVTTFADVVARYFFNKPFTFTVEVTELAMGLIVYLGVGLVTHENEHVSADVVTLRLSHWLRAAVGLATNVLALAFLAVMVWRVWLRAADLLAKGDITQIWHIPIWPVAFVMAFGAVFFISGVLLHMLGALQRMRSEPGPR
jgi:TRAP-type C4-dicarboxylate transport system permease small subunit